MKTFSENVGRDAQLVLAAMRGGFQNVCGLALHMSLTDPELRGGPDTVIAHGEWLKRQPEKYIDQVSIRTAYLEKQT